MSEEFTYKSAGVDTKRAASLVTDITGHVKRTQQNRKLFGAFGLFAAAYDLSDYSEPVIVTGCDGVGTKLELLLEHDMIEAAGKDLVAMSVNDILTTGGDPLLFLDYIGIAALDEEKITRLIAGMADYLEACNCILAGGETAEMPGIVPPDVIELSGFCIGAAEKIDLIDPSRVAVGDVLVGYPSDGFHANGFSLVRKVLKSKPDLFTDEEMVKLLAPTRLYHDAVAHLREAAVDVKAMAHITGGGLPENLERFLGEVGADLKIPAWENGVVEKLLAFLDPQEALGTFNMGFGWVAIVSAEDAEAACGGTGQILGKITAQKGVRAVIG